MVFAVKYLISDKPKMPYSIEIISKLLLIGFLTIGFIGCEVSAPVLYPDYTGQIGQISDIQGNVYKTIGIGSQIWMAENLRTTKLNNGSLIPQVESDSIWDFNPHIAFCWYNNDSICNAKIYGALYNFYTVRTELLCPIGWHIPRDSDWTILVDFLGGSEKAGGKLKDYYTSYWSEPNVCLATNYGFAALPGGRRSSYLGRFGAIREQGYWWTCTSKNDFIAYARAMYNNNTSISGFESSYGNGYSVRCIKD
jgi:uncharacterized protein (TIGR02145 family)